MVVEFFINGALRRPNSATASLFFSALRSRRSLNIAAPLHSYSSLARPIFYRRQPSPTSLQFSSTCQTLRIQASPVKNTRKTNNLISPLSLEQRRPCSYQRSMCKLTVDATTSSLDVSMGREVLPKNVKPTHYRLTFEPNLETFEFDGIAEIE